MTQADERWLIRASRNTTINAIAAKFGELLELGCGDVVLKIYSEQSPSSSAAKDAIQKNLSPTLRSGYEICME
jgi:hypothetical protein